ncbi:MAG: amidohydrolase [Crocinitomicaceae bacterium]|nr:amidohydrolase [Crocinitomicaceae bacterium]MCF8443579.1 amidohydrolase [Crocinitomicaceae bacterium]
MNPELTAFIKGKSIALYEKVKNYREHLHQHPELSYQEVETMRFVSEKLTQLGISHETGVGGTGVVALIQSEKHLGKSCIALRADLDALPISEENEVPYKSKVTGVMHACGHDVHTAILLGAAEILNEIKDDLPFPVKLIFQPGEEKNPGGATYMIRDKVLENPRVDKMYALHVFPDLPVGELGFHAGRYMASCDEIYITVNGKGGHGATPHQCIDPIVIGANIILQLQQLVSRKCDPKIPCVLSFGHFEALGATNIIPSKAILKGTFRTMDENWREQALKLVEQQVRDIAVAHGATVDIEISKGYPCVENDIALTNELAIKAKELIGNDKVHDLPIRLTSEDFAFYSQLVPACFFRLGVRNEEKGIVYGVHHPRFDIDSEALILGVRMMVAACL